MNYRLIVDGKTVAGPVELTAENADKWIKRRKKVLSRARDIDPRDIQVSNSNDNEDLGGPLTADSPKKDLKAALDAHNIEYPKSANKAQLWDLVETIPDVAQDE